VFDIVEAIHKALRIESTFWFVVVIAIGSAVVGGFFAWVIDIGYKRSPEFRQARNSPAAVQLSIACDIVSLPVVYQNELWMLSPVLGGLGKMTAPPLKNAFWPEEGARGLGYKCTLKNYGPETAFNTTMPLTISSFEWVQDAHGTWGYGEKLEVREVTISTPQPLGPQGTDQFSFYIGSYSSNRGFDVRLPSEGWINSDDHKAKQEVPIRISGGSSPLSVPGQMSDVTQPAK
jgi:hypothetical protein